MRGELYRPLGLDLPDRPKRRLPSLNSLGAFVVVGVVSAASVTVACYGQPQRLVVDRLAVAGGASETVDTEAASNVTVVRGAPATPPAEVARSELPIVISGPDDPDIDTAFTSGSIGFRVEDPASLRQDPASAFLPDPALIQESAFGPLPVRDGDGRRPFDVYAGGSSGKLGARVAIVVGGLGISQTGTQAAIRTLPSAVTFGFSPAGNSLDRWMQAARRGGHELLLQVPLEPVGYPTVDPGENTVLVDEAVAGDFAALYASLGRITNYVGILNYMGGRFTGDEPAMSAFLAELGRRGLMYLDDASSARSLSSRTAGLERVPSAVSDLAIDQSRDPADIRRALDTLERIARTNGSAIGVASAFDSSVQTIGEWIDEAESRGIEVVPVSALAADPERY